MNSPFYLRDIGRIWGIHQHNTDSMLYYYRAALNQAFHNRDTFVVKVISVELGAVYYDLGEIDSAKILSLRYQDKEDDFDGVVSMNLGRIYSREGQRDSA